MARVVIIGVYAKEIVSFRGDLIRDLVKNGHEVLAIAPEKDYQVEIETLGASYETVPFQRTGLNPVADLNSMVQLIKKLKRFKPDVVLSYTIKPVIYGSIAARAAGVRHTYSLITGLGYVFIGSTPQKQLLLRLIIILYKISCGINKSVFFQNPDDLKTFLNAKIISDDKKAVLVNGSGVNLDKFKYSRPSIDKISFLLIGRMIKDKGVLEFIDAAKYLNPLYPQVNFYLLGPYDENPTAISKIEIDKCVEQGIIEYLGEVEDVRPFIVNSSVFVLPSYREGTPRSTLEAMAMGRAVITTDAPGCRETVINDINGYLVPVKDSKAIAEAMEYFIKHPESIIPMGIKSREIAEEKFDVHIINRIMMQAMGLNLKENPLDE